MIQQFILKIQINLIDCQIDNSNILITFKLNILQENNYIIILNSIIFLYFFKKKNCE